MAIRMTLVALVCALAGNVYAQEPLAAPSPEAARAGASAVTTGNVSAAALREDRVQSIIDEMRGRLGLQPLVRAQPVSENSRVASVRRDSEQRNAFVISIQEDFLDSLTDEELSAVAAHELGHIWIFTHHPFLQTEELANEIALRAVSRAALDQLYDKLWKRTGQKGELEYFPR
jgi:Zn-dependent protease with chaperone function